MANKLLQEARLINIVGKKNAVSLLDL